MPTAVRTGRPAQDGAAHRDEIARAIAPHFARTEPCTQAVRYVCSLLAAGAGNSWTVARAAGDPAPWRMQRLLCRASWDAEGVTGVAVSRLVSGLADPAACLVLDDLAVPKSGTHAAGVTRRYSPATGRVQNCQTLSTATYVAPAGTAVVGCEPVPAGPAPAAHGVPACRILDRLRRRDVPVGWVVGGRAHAGDDLRARLVEHGQPHLFAVACRDAVTVPGGWVRPADRLADLPERAWIVRGGDEWASAQLPGRTNGGRHRLVFRRERRGTATSAYLVWSPARPSPAELVRAASVAPAAARYVRALDERLHFTRHELRTARSWSRHLALTLLAQSALTDTGTATAPAASAA